MSADFMEQYYAANEEGSAELQAIDFGHRLMSGFEENPEALRRFIKATAQQERLNLLLAGTTCSFNPEYFARLYRALVHQVLRDTSLPIKRAFQKKPLHMIAADFNPAPLKTLQDSMGARIQHLQERAGIEITPLQVDLSKPLANRIEEGTIHLIFMDCLLSCTANGKGVIEQLSKLLTPEGVLLFRATLMQQIDDQPVADYQIEMPYRYMSEACFQRVVQQCGLKTAWLKVKNPALTASVNARERVGLLYR